MIAYFLSHPIFYFTPIFQKLARETSLEVYFYSDCSIRGEFDKGFGAKVKWDAPLINGYTSFFLKNIASGKTMNCRLFDAVNLSIPRKVYSTKASIIIINGWSYFSDWLVLLSAFIFGKEVWMRIESPQHQEEQKKGFKQSLKSFFLRKIVFRYLVKKFLYIGYQNRLFYEKSGVQSNRLIYTPYAVDNDKFRDAYKTLLPRKQSIKAELGIPLASKVVVFCGKYIHQKRPLDLLKSIAAINDSNLYLVMIGEGYLRSDMQEFISSNKMKSVLLTGFVNQSKIAEYYIVADLFVMTSGMGETWGLAVNEAMNFNLPIIVSKTCGSSYDLVREGNNGFTFCEGDILDLSKKIQYCLSDDDFRKSAGIASSVLVANYSIQSIVDNIMKACTLSK